MERYIKKSELEKIIGCLMPSMSTPDGSGVDDDLIFAAQEMCVDILEAIKSTPSEEVKPVIYSKWVYKPYDMIWYDKSNPPEFVCEHCGDRAYNTHDFCPSCGAIMDLINN